jgi:hypothetical protein
MNERTRDQIIWEDLATAMFVISRKAIVTDTLGVLRFHTGFGCVGVAYLSRIGPFLFAASLVAWSQRTVEKKCDSGDTRNSLGLCCV